MSEVFIPDFEAGNGSAYMDKLERGLRMGIEQEKVQYKVRQHAAAGVWDGVELDKKSSFRPQMVIDSRTYFRWDQQEKGCWEDKGFEKQFLKDNPECLVKNWLK